MALQLFQLAGHPNRIGASKIDSFVTDGVFFLDFTRPLEKVKKFGVLVQGVLVPVIHQGEQAGMYVIGVHRGDPLFAQVRVLWKERYPSAPIASAAEADGLKIVSDFATQFPDDNQ